MEPHGELSHAWLQDFQLCSIRIQPGAHTNGKDRVGALVTKVIGCAYKQPEGGRLGEPGSYGHPTPGAGASMVST